MEKFHHIIRPKKKNQRIDTLKRVGRTISHYPSHPFPKVPRKIPLTHNFSHREKAVLRVNAWSPQPRKMMPKRLSSSSPDPEYLSDQHSWGAGRGWEYRNQGLKFNKVLQILLTTLRLPSESPQISYLGCLTCRCPQLIQGYSQCSTYLTHLLWPGPYTCPHGQHLSLCR